MDGTGASQSRPIPSAPPEQGWHRLSTAILLLDALHVLEAVFLWFVSHNGIVCGSSALSWVAYCIFAGAIVSLSLALPVNGLLIIARMVLWRAGRSTSAGEVAALLLGAALVGVLVKWTSSLPLFGGYWDICSGNVVID